MIQIDMEMPKCCDECFALDDHGDYPFCLISQDQRGYTFNTKEKRMPTCPLNVDRRAEGGDTVVNKNNDWHRERRVGEAVKAGIKCFCGSEAYRDILEVTMNCETFPRVQRIFCPNCGLQMRSPAGNDDDFIVRQWRDISDLHQHRKEEQDRADRAVGMDDLIPRAAAIDAIVSVTAFPDAEYIKNLCQNPANSEDWLGGVCDAINAVEDVNAVDAAPVVRCKDCKHFEVKDVWANFGNVPILVSDVPTCHRWEGECNTSPDGFCFLGERRDGK